jgi:hypothetical protein
MWIKFCRRLPFVSGRAEYFRSFNSKYRTPLKLSHKKGRYINHCSELGALPYDEKPLADITIYLDRTEREVWICGLHVLTPNCARLKASTSGEQVHLLPEIREPYCQTYNDVEASRFRTRALQRATYWNGYITSNNFWSVLTSPQKLMLRTRDLQNTMKYC